MNYDKKYQIALKNAKELDEDSCMPDHNELTEQELIQQYNEYLIYKIKRFVDSKPQDIVYLEQVVKAVEKAETQERKAYELDSMLGEL